MAIDYHVHSNYSDGMPMWKMLRAARDEPGLAGIGFADHCNVSDRETMVENKFQWGFNIDQTFDRRRKAIESFRDRFGLEILNGFELDYDPRDEENIEAFIQEAEPDYTIGSIHWIEGRNVHEPADFADCSVERKREFVERYVDVLEQLIRSDLFDIVGHLDVIEGNREIRGMMAEKHYLRVADALEQSMTVAEVNAVNVYSTYGALHPGPRFLELLRDRDLSFVIGTDAHGPKEFTQRFDYLQHFFREHGLSPATIEIHP